MVARQILVLLVGVRVLLGELKAGPSGRLFLHTPHRVPSSIG